MKTTGTVLGLLLFGWAVSFLVPPIIATGPPASRIEIVESIPVETTLDNPDIRDAREVWLEMIGDARRMLDIEQYYVSDAPGKRLEAVLAAVEAAAGRGVKVRILVDARMARTYPESVDRLGRIPNIEARRIDFGAVAGGIQHAKYFVVDGGEVFVGSQNFDWRALEHIHELGLRIRDEAIAAAFSDVFAMDWTLAALSPEAAKRFSEPSKTYRTPVRITTADGTAAEIVPTFSPLGRIPDPRLWDEKAIVDLIDGAKRLLTLQFLSYSTSDRSSGRYGAIDDALRRAAQRGVEVRMIVSDWEKASGAEAALKSLSAVPNIAVAFSAIPEWSGGYIPFARVEHCKYIVADETRFWLGTSNGSKDYFYSSRNLGIAGTSPELAGTLARIFRKSWESPYRESITPTGTYAPREHGEKKSTDGMPRAGFEPARPSGLDILSVVRLPVPPPGRFASSQRRLVPPTTGSEDPRAVIGREHYKYWRAGGQ
jgi:phosphatidylserine/phosphatidylglycerophosphate/cardiolipin synthase-like enzyme